MFISNYRDNYRRDYADAVDFGPDQALGGAAASTSGPAYVTPIYAPANTAAASRNGEQQQPPRAGLILRNLFLTHDDVI